MAIKSSKFSFIRFGGDEAQGCADINYVLPAYGTHEVAFQFEPVGNADIDGTYSVFVTDAGCGNPVSLGVDSVRLNYKAVMVLSQPGDFFLQTVTYGAITNTYNEIVTLDEFLDILQADFGLVAEADPDGTVTFYTICDLTLAITATTDPDGGGSAVTGDFNLYYGKGYVDLSGIDLPGGTACFRLQIGGTCSNLFKPIIDPCFTSLFTYSCKESAFEFVYPDTPNKVRVPAYLTKPIWPKTRQVYRRSSGRNLLLSSVVDKVYPLVTDHMPEVFHECMAIALSHDDIIIQNTNIREGLVEVIESDDYGPEWIGEDPIHNLHPIAQGRGKLKVAKYSYANSNCGSSADPCDQVVVVPPGECLPPVFTLNFPDAVEGSLFDLTVPITGTGPFGITPISIPAWLTVVIDGSNVHFTGTPGFPDIGTETVSFTITHDCDAATVDYSGNINILGPGGISITSSQPGTSITNVTGVSGFTFNTGAPIGAGGSQTGAHSSFTGAISVTFTGTLLFNPGNITWSKNGVPFGCTTVTGPGTYASPSESFAATDAISISLNGGSC